VDSSFITGLLDVEPCFGITCLFSFLHFSSMLVHRRYTWLKVGWQFIAELKMFIHKQKKVNRISHVL
jgi:hypothetical protein